MNIMNQKITHCKRDYNKIFIFFLTRLATYWPFSRREWPRISPSLVGNGHVLDLLSSGTFSDVTPSFSECQKVN